MIFGFNTDIRHNNTVYHVQSEAREGEQLLQTQVFVRGRCIGKRAISWSSREEEGDILASSPADIAERFVDQNHDQDKERQLRELHREVLEAIRAGRLDSVLDRPESPEALAAEKELIIEWTNSDSVHADGALLMKLLVTEEGIPVEGARLTFRVGRPGVAPYYAQVLSDARGNAEMSVQVDEKMLADSSVLVQASFGGRTATRKFELRPAN